MRKITRKRYFIVNEVLSGVVLSTVKICAANEKSLWSTSLMRELLLNKSADSVIMIYEV